MNFIYELPELPELPFAEPEFGFQDPATPVMEGIIDLHNYIFFYAVLILFFVLWILISIIYNFYFKVRYSKSDELLSLRYLLISGRNVTHGTALEIVWTLIPSIILIAIAVPSFALLYSMDDVTHPGLVLKVIGHQWYWSYQYSNFIHMAPLVEDVEYIAYFFVYAANEGITFKEAMKGAQEEGIDYWSFIVPMSSTDSHDEAKLIMFDSYMIAENDLKLGQLRLLEVDNQVVLPVHTQIRAIVTGADVLHSWAIPSLGIKIDTVPGRLSQVDFFLKREGVFYGQCSEICGVNHGFMPIVIKGAIINPEWNSWVDLNFRGKHIIPFKKDIVWE